MLCDDTHHPGLTLIFHINYYEVPAWQAKTNLFHVKDKEMEGTRIKVNKLYRNVLE